MDTNILAASFAGGMIGGLTGAYIASRSYKKEVVKGLDEKSSPESSSSEENNKSSEEQKLEENKASTEEQKTEDNKKSSKDATEDKHVDAEVVGVDPTASINDKEEK